MDGFNSNIEDIVTGLGNPNGVVVDPVGGKVYWSDQNTSEINRADIDVTGGPNQNIETIITTGTGFAKHLDLLFDPGDFTLTDAELDFITAGTLTIGDATAGDITITSEISPANITTLELISGGVIADANTTATDIAATNVILDGNVSPGTSPGVLNVNGNFDFADNDTFSVEIGGTAAGDTAGSHDQIAVTGTVSIGTNVTLSTSAFGGFTPTIGDTFTIIDNDGTADAITGTFVGLAEGGVISDFLGSGLDATISYTGGNGNDVVLTFAEPTQTEVTLAGGVLTITDSNGGSSDDDFTIGQLDGTNYTITDNNGEAFSTTIAGSTGNGTDTLTIPATGINSIQVNTLGGDDSLIVNNNLGVIGVPINFDGGGQGSVAGDSLSIVNDLNPATTQTLIYTNTNDGSIVLDGVTITYVGLEPIDAGNAADTILNLPDATANLATLQDDAGNAGFIEIVGATFENTVIPNPTNSLTVNLGDLGDQLLVSTLDVAYAVPLIINGGAAATDNVQLNAVDLDTDDLGRGLWVTETEILGITDGTITDNTAVNGGGILIDNSTSGTSTTATLTGVTVSDNVATGGVAPTDGGGGIYNNGATLNIVAASMITGNMAITGSGSGGGVLNTGTLVVAASTISGNSANRAGGGIEAAAGSTTTLTGVTLDNNNAGVAPATAAPGNGGGLHITGNGNATITGGTINGNMAEAEGGGLWNGTGTMIVDGTTIDGNTSNSAGAAADQQGGGGIFNQGGTLDIDDAMITGNTALDPDAGGTQDDGGGGIFDNGGTVTIDNTTISGNLATDGLGNGGGILTFGGNVTINGGTITSNMAARAGGGIENNDGTVTLNGVTVGGAAVADGNTTGVNGGGLHVSGPGTTNVTGGLFQNNTAGQEGGGLWNGTGVMMINGTNITENTASGTGPDQGGGGVFNAGGTINIDAAQLTNNTADGSGGSGGGVLNDALGTVAITGTAITGNTANRAGGGIEATAGTTTNLTNVNLDTNNAGVSPAVAAPGNGGGLHISGNGNATITGGTVNANMAEAEGGGLWNGTGTMIVDGTTIDGNTANSAGAALDQQGGGGIFNQGGTLDIDNAFITGNTALDPDAGGTNDDGGGGIFDNGGLVTIDNTTISGNMATDGLGNGGGILTFGGNVTIDGGTISGNTSARAGGGIENFGGTVTIGGTTPVTVGGPLVSDGNTAGINGGGLHVSGTGTTNVTDGVFQNNVAGQEGGGLWNSGAGAVMTIDGTTITNNTANGNGIDQGGGGIFNNGGTVEATNLTLSNNVANTLPGSGGGATSDGGTLNISDSDIENNDRFGIWLINGASGTIVNNTFSGNAIADVAIQGTAGNDTYTVNATSITDGTNTTTIDGTVGLLALGTMAGEDTVNITASPNTAFLLNGGDPSASPGDTLVIDAAGQSVTNDGITATVGANQPIDYSEFETIQFVNAGPFTVSGDGLDNVLQVTRGSTLDSILYTLDGGQTFEVQTDSFTFNGLGGNDTLDADYESNGFFTTNITFDGNASTGAPGDFLNVDGTFDLQTFNHIDFDGNGNNGNVVLTLGADSSTITYTGLEPINGGNSADTIVNLPAGFANSATLQDDADIVGNIEIIDNGATFEDTTFPNPTNSLTVNLGDMGDLLQVNALDAAYAVPLVINGGADANDTVQLTGVNLDTNDLGRGLWVTETETLGINASTITDNTAPVGGGILIDNSTSATTTTTIMGVTVSDNVATAGASAADGGGGIYNRGGGLLSIDGGSMITGNAATGAVGSGGGIFSTGTLTVTGATITGNDANRAGGGIEIGDGSGPTTLTDVTLTLNDALAGPGNGGGLHVTGAGNVAIVRGTVTGNTAASEGGGLWNGGGTMSINGTLIENNTASGDAADNGGGGVFNNAGVLDIDDAIIQGNQADGILGSGGGVFSLANTVVIDNSTIQNNSANRAGGGIEVVAGTVTLTNLQLLTNDVDGLGMTANAPNPGNGGGLHVTATATVTLAGGLVQGNVAREEGGGLWNSDTGTLIIDNVMIDANTARAADGGIDQGGGGVFNNGGDLFIRNNTTITNNLATDNLGNGGGVMTVGGMVVIDNTTLTGNQAARAGGGIENTGGTVTLTNVTVGGANLADGNIAGINGGGLHAAGLDSITVVNGGLFQNNIAQQEGGGLWNGPGMMTINNTTITSNFANAGEGTTPDSNLANDQGGGGVFNIGGMLDHQFGNHH